jgi:hypothetical protein
MKDINFKRILFYLWPQMKKHWVSLSLIFTFYTIGIIGGSTIRPYLYKKIIDALSSGLPKDVIFNNATHLVIISCIVIVIYNIGYRLGDFAYKWVFPE